MLNVKKCVKVCVEKYGLSEKEAFRIATTDNILLSLQELRYKYDDMLMGTEYPDWITPEEHLKMCYSTVFKKYYGNDKLSKNFYSYEDVAMDLYLYSAIHIHTYKDKFQLYGLLLCRMKNLLRDKMKEADCYAEVYDWEEEHIKINNSENDVSKYNKLVKYNMISKDTADIVELVMTVESIKNKNIKGILLVCGYFLADIQEFLEPLVNYYNDCPKKIQEKIYDLGKENLQFCRVIKMPEVSAEKSSVTIGKILKICGKRNKASITMDIIPYLKNIGFINM